MASLILSILQPSAADIEEHFSVSGELTPEATVDGEQVSIKSVNWVRIAVGANAEVAATLTGPTTWRCELTVPNGSLSGEPVSISAAAEAIVTSRIPGRTRDEVVRASDSTQKLLKKEPELSVQYASPGVTTEPTYPFEFSGIARNGQYGMTSVKFRINDGPWEDVDKLTDNWSSWRKIKDMAPGSFRLSVEATGGAPYFLKKTIPNLSFVIRTPFQPTDVEQVFANTTYLRELLQFAGRQVKIGNAAGPTPAQLAAHFLQPFDKLIQPQAYEQATREIAQSRLAVEVLRQHLVPPVPPEIDQQYRALAYRTLLRELGVSYEELRLARLADQPARQALAARLGFQLEGSRPDHLDQLTQEPGQISDEALAELFGYQPPLPGDPLQAASPAPRLALWRAEGLRQTWLREDAQSRDGLGRYLPIIDPDLIDAGRIISQSADNPPYALWLARRDWIAAKLAEIAQTAGQSNDALVRFDAIVDAHIDAALDLPALAARDALGEDLSAALDSVQMDLDGFRFLARCRALLAAGNTLDDEWHDIYTIALQRQKRLIFQTWRNEERQINLTLAPDLFVADSAAAATEIPRWRGSRRDQSKWRRTLQARAKQKQSLEQGFWSALATAEQQVLPALRDTFLALEGNRQSPVEDAATAAERLSRKLMIDFQSHAEAKTTRIDQAVETLQAILFSVRAGRVAGTDGVWSINEAGFDAEWNWIGGYRTWLAAMKVFAYPENQLFPNLYVGVDNDSRPTNAFADGNGLLAMLRRETKPTPESIRAIARSYVSRLRAEHSGAAAGLPSDFELTDRQLTPEQLRDRLDKIAELFNGITNPNNIPQYLREVFWLAPMALAQRLQEQREYLTALDWYQTVYAYELPLSQRKRYPGLQLEAALALSYNRTPAWLAEELNPYIVVRAALSDQRLVGRPFAHCRFAVMAIVRCLLAYADQTFSRGDAESIAQARSLYQSALDLLKTPELAQDSDADIPFPANPVWQSIQLHAQANLSKIHNGMNIAGVRDISPRIKSASSSILPSQYRYTFLVERAKNLTGIAQQLEAAYLAALEKRDAENYGLMQANRDLKTAGATLSIANLKMSDADLGVQVVILQKEKSEIQEDYYEERLQKGLSKWERDSLSAMVTAQVYQAAAGLASGLSGAVGSGGNPFALLGGLASAKAGFESANAQIFQTRASYERREQEWRLQRNTAQKDRQIGELQTEQARNQHQIAAWERHIARLQLDHATEVLDFLANKFTNAELFEWMSGVLGGVYAYFLQQAAALAQLAEAQLAFERQETPAGLISADYWTDIADGETAADRRGLTGSARLLRDIYQLDQYALDTDRRKLHLSQVLSLAHLDPQELQVFRDTGVLTFATPESLFDREFPGHYLRLVKRVKVSLIALIPPSRGVRASLSASGLSRTVIGGDEFKTVTLARAPETIAFTAPLNATGLFELEADTGMLLPFEGMGLDTIWRLELPKPANPFNFQTIADVLLTIDYTAFHSYDYRQKVVRGLDRSFSSDRVFSVRDQFADAWYELNNPDQVPPERQMQIKLSLRSEDLPIHVTDSIVSQVSLYCVRADDFEQEIRLMSLSHNGIVAGETISQGGIVTTRRPSGTPWQTLVGQNPVGDWTLQLENTPALRQAFKDDAIFDLVLILSTDSTTPEWPQ